MTTAECRTCGRGFDDDDILFEVIARVDRYMPSTTERVAEDIARWGCGAMYGRAGRVSPRPCASTTRTCRFCGHVSEGMTPEGAERMDRDHWIEHH